MRLFSRSAKDKVLSHRPRRFRLADVWILLDRLGYVGMGERALFLVLAIPFFLIAMGSAFSGASRPEVWFFTAILGVLIAFGVAALVRQSLGLFFRNHSPLAINPDWTRQVSVLALMDPEIKSRVESWLEQTQSPTLTPRQSRLIIAWGMEKGLDPQAAQQEVSFCVKGSDAVPMDEAFCLDFPGAPCLPDGQIQLFSKYRLSIQLMDSAVGHLTRARTERTAREMDQILDLPCGDPVQRLGRL